MFFKWLSMLALLATAVMARAEPSPPPAPTHRPTADFAQLPFMLGPRLSPDGSRIAAKVALHGTQLLSIVRLAGDKPPVVLGLGALELNSWAWVNDEWLVAQVGSVQHFEGDTIYVTRVVGIGINGKIVPISFDQGGQQASIVWIAHDGTPRILMSFQKSLFSGSDFWPSVSEVDVSTGRIRPVVEGRDGVMSWYADPAGSVRMGVGYDDSSRTSRLLYRAEGKGTFHTIDRANQRTKDSLTIPILTSDPAAPALTISDTTGFDAVHELDLTTLAVGKKIFGIDGYDVDDYELSPDGKRLNGVYFTSDQARVHWLDPALNAIQELLDKAVAPRTARIVSLSRDQSLMIVMVGDASQPGTYYFFDAAAGGSMRRFAYVNDTIKSASLSRVNTFRYKARDGLDIEAILTLPKGRPERNLPLIVLPHGGPEARDEVMYDWWVQFLADRGYAVVQPNYRGSTGYGQAFLDAGNGEWGLKMQDDLNDAVRYLADKGTIDPKRVCISGASYGGYAALRGAQRDGALFRCAIAFAGVSDLNGMMSYDGRFLNSNAHRAGWKEAAVDLKGVSPINFASEFSTPVLIVHGKADLRVPVNQSRKMAERLKAAGKQVEYIEQPLGDHHFSREADRLQFLEASEAFLKKYNPAD